MKRLELLVSLVDEGRVVADIGTDHGITAIEVYEKKNPKRVIATDISKNSLKKLEDKILRNGYEIESLVSDGIKDLSSYGLENIIISGMGGYLISEIIERGFEVAKSAEKLILQANNSLDHLRKFLHAKNFHIIDEHMVYEDGIYYDIIVASFLGSGMEIPKNYNYEFGQNLIDKKDKILKDYLKNRLEIIGSINRKLSDNDSVSSRGRRLELADEKARIEEVLKCY